MIVDTKTLPIQVQKSLPPEALKVFLEGVNKALSHNSYEEVAMAAGWAEVRAAGWERQDGTWITKSEGHDSVWIGLWVPADTAEELALEGEEAEKPNDLHLTLVILGAVQDMAPETIKQVKAIIAKLAEENGPIMGETSGIGRYSNGSGETDVVYASFDSPSLSRFREVLVTSLKAAEIPVPENHGFDPHITLAYIDDSTDVILEGDIPEIPITFETLDLRIGDEMRSFPFNGKAEKNDNDIKVNIAKMDDDQHLVFGWLSISKDEDGQYILDSQGDIIEPEELEKAAYNFALYAREAGEMHRRIGIGKMVESCIFTKEKQEAMGIQPGQIPECAWWIGFHIDDDDTWEKVKKGEYRAFSIGGSAIREAVEIDERSGGIDKHYSGKHDQKTHGRRFGASGQALPKGSKRTFQVNAKGRKEYKETGRLPQGKELYENLDDKIREKELEIKDRKTERCYVFNEKGEVILSKVGSKDSIDFTSQEVQLFKDAILIHNHPRGTSLSDADIHLACSGEVKEIRAIGSQYRYSVKPPESGWSGKTWTTLISDAVDRHYRDVYREFTEAIANGLMTSEQASANHWHEVWTRVARDTGIQYKREAWSQ